MMEARYMHGCSRFWLNGEQIIAVSQGEGLETITTVEFLNLNDEYLQWIPGPDLPDYSWTGTQMISNGDTLFYINTYVNVFLRMECGEWLHTCQWINMQQKLEFTRKNAFATLVPDYLTDCN